MYVYMYIYINIYILSGGRPSGTDETKNEPSTTPPKSGRSKMILSPASKSIFAEKEMVMPVTPATNAMARVIWGARCRRVRTSRLSKWIRTSRLSIKNSLCRV